MGVTARRDTELPERLAEAGRRLGVALTEAMERIRPAVAAVTEVASRPEVKSVLERAEKMLRRRPCLCLCARTHPADAGICEPFDAVITRPHDFDLLGEIDVPLCAPCAAARAAREFSG
jgi:hypothetical protein